MEDLLWLSARAQRDLLVHGDVSAVELMNAHYDQIEAHNGRVNALVNLLPRDRAVALAAEADAAKRRGTSCGALHGLPMAPKDMLDTIGFPTTFGFVPYAERIARADSTLVARQRAAGAIMIAKSNMPEFGLGSHTFNSLFGATRNPYAPDHSAGGSSGGAAAALASGMLAVADGSDMGGSLRNPASFCNVVGFRPSIGRVPDERGFGWLARLATAGPMARSVSDAALLFSVQAGPHAPDPLTLSEPGSSFAALGEARGADLKVACSEDLGALPIDAEVRTVIREAAATFADLGATVDQDHPDLSDAMDVFQIQRAAALAATGRALNEGVPDWRVHAKETAVWNIDKGLALTGEELISAELQRTALYRRVVGFFERYDLLVLPSAQVPPFPIDMEWVREIDGRTMPTYIDWMAVCCAISVTGLPAVSVPGGFTTDGRPIGVQLVAGPRQDARLLVAAQLFEQATGHGQRRPDFSLLAG